MKYEDFTPEEIDKLPDDVQQGLKDGTVLALSVPKPTLSNRAFTVYAALIVGAMLVPIWVPLNSIAFLGAALGALGWMTLYKVEGNIHARTKMNLAITEGVLNRTFEMITQAADKQRNINGTNDGESCLKEEKDSTESVH